MINLFLSLIFGVGQVVIGAAMMIFTGGKARWRQITFFGLGLLGAWLATSGLTELVVSGTELLAQLGQHISITTAAQIRASADRVFLDVSLVLLAAGAGYLLLARRWTRPHTARETNAKETNASSSESSSADQEPPAEVTSTEPDR